MSVAVKKAQWTRTEDGRLVLDPAPVIVETITLDVFERGMLLLGIDPDAALSGSVDWSEVRRPPLKRAQAFLELALENADAYALREMEADRADAFLAIVTGHFIEAARGNW